MADAMRKVVGELAPKFGAGEAKAMWQIMLENLKGWTPVDIAIRANERLSDFILDKISGVVERLMADEPIQYIFGKADFYGMKFNVNRDTLIPRPETAELVDMIVDENRIKDLRVLDIGTGSGCIAVALARNLPFAEVTASDISRCALDVARMNAAALHARVRFIECDMLRISDSMAALGTGYSIIVSNPPYIAESERSGMENNVLMHEPASALFVPDSDPLVFYIAILNYAQKGLTDDGRIYFELNPRFAEKLAELCAAHGFCNVQLARDSFGKSRFLRAMRQ